MLTLLARCDGRSLDEICREHMAAGHAQPPRRLLRTLLDHDLLEDADTPAPGPPRGPGRAPDQHVTSA